MPAASSPPSPEELERIRREFPAKYPARVLEVFAAQMAQRLLGDPLVLDPFAGVGGIHQLRDHYPCRTLGIELEPECALAAGPDTICGDSRNVAELLPDLVGQVPVVAFSPAYGNRFSDQYLGSDNEKCRRCNGHGAAPNDEDPCGQCAGSGKARSRRASYAITLGRRLTPGSGASLLWGQRYRETHGLILRRLAPMLAPGGLWLVNISSVILEEQYQPVMEWWVAELAKHARIVELVPVPTQRRRHGANHDARVPVEHVIVAEAAA